MQAGLALATLPWLAESAQAGLAAQKSPLFTDEPLNKLSDITRYNNFYEFGVDKAGSGGECWQFAHFAVDGAGGGAGCSRRARLIWMR